MMAAIPGEGSQDPCLLLRHDESAISVTHDRMSLHGFVYFTVRTTGAKVIYVP